MTEKVLIEINRLKNELDGYSAREALDYIESYINTLSKQQVEEPVPAKLGAEHLADAHKTSPKDLEEAAKRYSNNKHPMTPTGARESQEDFIAGAKWQEEKEKEYSPWLVIPKLKEAALEFGEQAKDYEIGWQSFAEDMAIAFTRGAEWQKEQMMKMITKDDNLEEAGKRYVETYFRDIDWTPDVIKSCLEEAFISGGEYVFKQIKYE